MVQDVLTVSGLCGGVFGVFIIILIAVALKCRKMKASKPFMRRRFGNTPGNIPLTCWNNFHCLLMHNMILIADVYQRYWQNAANYNSISKQTWWSYYLMFLNVHTLGIFIFFIMNQIVKISRFNKISNFGNKSPW